MFQSRNRGSFDFKKWIGRPPPPNAVFCFNLVIEVLLISRNGQANSKRHSTPKGFNLVIEVLLISRNPNQPSPWCKRHRSFNLVIEVLLISSAPKHTYRVAQTMFQSRNRGSFDFKAGHVVRYGSLLPWFQSRNRGSFDFKKKRVRYGRSMASSFNLVIEVLLISSLPEATGGYPPYQVSIS